MPLFAFFQNMGFPELIIILIIALLIFGHKLPSVARSLGSSINEFKKGAREDSAEADKQAKQDQVSATTGAATTKLVCGGCGAAYVPATPGAPCPNCGKAPPKPPAPEKN